MNIPDDDFIRELLPEFVDDWVRELSEKYDLYIADKNSTDMYRLAHTLKGSCYQFGLNDLGDMGIKLMAVCKENDWNTVQKMGVDLKKSFAEIQVFIQNNPM